MKLARIISLYSLMLLFALGVSAIADDDKKQAPKQESKPATPVRFSPKKEKP